ncbi:nucleotide sugar dehydrogenase [Phocicoccus pinnipedialis]|uniref:UDP-N-acetyl-D-glucosamine 6-dehydrogenase n=1 Tax=Phocicoccus pinnipedialis TaxID=110845 RepID=A0A6V7RM69_9BACL|nr:nucleotide sugar dehydrogenase [Jeotgalicoccus pinnipedialis]MBP1938812.1 UDP-N-acetyl-D-galactosamine dehydrogenase [Jeotgalicoccus pinnipedialis]CAD2079255.1 UDP-N-acetyl-D-glucosamine 6-dehydrogenase [Jeotgalicoccus pinnipedialis]
MNRNIGVIGLGYVGLPMAVSFGKKQPVTGFDINKKRIQELKSGYDRTNEVEFSELQKADLTFTDNLEDLTNDDFLIVAVPTPINENNQPDLTPLLKASETVGKILKKGQKNTIVVFESTVYPGATEEDCVPVIEKVSGLKSGVDFFVGYSPERINPGDKVNTFESIVKVVSGQTPETQEIIAQVYETVVEAGVHKASSIKVAEAAKVIENTQRDVNIALMNEIAIICGKAGIDTNEVLKAAGTKWNFLNFTPGLVGGHCIGVDPYYLTYKAQELGYHPEVILSGRRINDNMPKIIASDIIKKLMKNGIEIQNKTINFLGLTFKEDLPDLRNTKVVDLIQELQDFGLNVDVNDVEANKEEAKNFYNIDLKDKSELMKTDALVLAVKHNDYVENLSIYLDLVTDEGIIFDIKGVVKEEDLKAQQKLWRL